METRKSRGGLSGISPLPDKTLNDEVLPMEVLQTVEIEILLEELAEVIESEDGILIP